MHFFTPKNIDDNLLTLITQNRTRMKTIENNFQNTQNPQLISSYIYELKALEGQYSYYLSLCKSDQELSVTVDL